MIKLLVTEFAESKQEIERELKSKTWPILEHLGKCLIMSDSQSYNHWKKEIINFIYRVDKLKGKNKLPTYKQILDWTYNKISDCIDVGYLTPYFNKLENNYNICINSSYKDIVYILNELCKQYFTLLANELSTIGYLDTIKANKLIDDFIKMHSIDVEYD